MEQHSAFNDVFQVIEMFIELKLNMKTILDTYLHFHLLNFLGLFHIAVVMQYSEIWLFNDCGFHVPVDNYSNEVSHSPSNAVECFIFLLEICKFEFETFSFSQYACRF